MQKREILGHIDCPACGGVGAMRVTLDKNKKPFGFCAANCNAQLRIGGNDVRERAFVKMYPWAAETGGAQEPEPERRSCEGQAKIAQQAAQKAVSVPEKKPASRAPFDLNFGG